MTALENARRLLDQWDNHDKYKITAADKALFPNGEEPVEIEIIRAFVQLSTAMSHYLKN
jgi:hypothetical protein